MQSLVKAGVTHKQQEIDAKYFHNQSFVMLEQESENRKSY